MFFGNFQIYCLQNCTNSINRSCNLTDVGGLMFLGPLFILTTNGAIFSIVTSLTNKTHFLGAGMDTIQMRVSAFYNYVSHCSATNVEGQYCVECSQPS